MSGLSALRSVARPMRGRAVWLGIGAAISVLSAVLAAALAYASGGVLAHGFGPAAAAVASAGTALGLLGAARVGLRYIERLATHDAMFRALSDVRVWFFRGVAGSSAGGLGLRSAGDVLSRLVSDVGALDGLYLRIAVPVIVGVALVPLALAAAGLTGFAATAAMALLLAVALVAVPRAVLARTRPGAAAETRAQAGLRVTITDTVAGLRDVLAFGAGPRATAAMEDAEARLIAAQGASQAAVSRAGAASVLCGQFAVLIVAAAAALAATGATDTRRAVLVAAVFLIVAAFEAFAAVPRAAALAAPAAAAAARVVEAATEASLYPEPRTPITLAPVGRFALQLDTVTFRYRPGGEKVLDGLSLDLPRGQHAALLGPSGAGKSTVAALALRVVAPEAGWVRLDGTDVAALTAATVHAHVTLLHQGTHIFGDTIRRNLLLSRQSASDEMVWEALDAARLADTVWGLPGGLDFWVDEGGANLSGGQARRLALARALLSPAKLLILDEPASGLDAVTEREFFDALAGAAANRTVLLIAHRLTGAEPVDRVFRLRAGRAVAAAG